MTHHIENVVLRFLAENETGEAEERRWLTKLPFAPFEGMQVELPEDARGKVFLGVVPTVRVCLGAPSHIEVFLDCLSYRVREKHE